MDDELAVRFQALTIDVHQQLRLAPSARVRAVGDRRRRKAVAGVAGIVAGVTALVGGGTAALLAPSPGQPPASPPPNPTALPALFTLPHEGKEGWRLNETRTVPLAFDRCAGSPDATLAGRTDARTVSAPDDSVVEQVLVFRDESAAVAAMSAVMLNCQFLTYPLDNQGFGSFGTDNVTDFADQIGRRGNVIFFTKVRGPVGEGAHEIGRQMMAYIADGLCDTMSLCGGPSWTAATPTPSASASGAHPR